MNREWSEKCKKVKVLISKESTFKEGIEELLELRGILFEEISKIVRDCPEDFFWEMPFAKADGYHSKSLAYSIWHIFRIEDICCHVLMMNDRQVLDHGKWQKKTGADIITTGNELEGKQIEDFSRKLKVKPLLEYAKAVMDSTNDFLKSAEYSQLKKRFNEEDRSRVVECKGVSEDEKAVWLIDYWCGKNGGGLLNMPFSRHWIMHIEAMLKIKDKLFKLASKNV